MGTVKVEYVVMVSNSNRDLLAFASGVKYIVSCLEASAQLWRK